MDKTQRSKLFRILFQLIIQNKLNAIKAQKLKRNCESANSIRNKIYLIINKINKYTNVETIRNSLIISMERRYAENSNDNADILIELRKQKK